MSTHTTIHRRIPGVGTANLSDGRLLVFSSRGLVIRDAIDVADLNAVLECVDGKRSDEEVARLLSDRFESVDILSLLRHLEGDLLECGEQDDPDFLEDVPFRPRDTGCDTLLLGRGRLFHYLASELQQVDALELPQGLKSSLKGRKFVYGIVDQGRVTDLHELCELAHGAAISLCLIYPSPKGFALGPTFNPGRGPCSACQQLGGLTISGVDARDLFLTGARVQLSSQITKTTAESILSQLKQSILANPKGSAFDQMLFDSKGGLRIRRVLRDPKCSLCGNWNSKVRSREPLTPLRIGILGGGTAGYLCALALNRKYPEVDVTLIESKKIPIIGVGEATTPLMPQFLHEDLGLDVAELFKEVTPTLKLGIRFEWGKPGHSFNYPFGKAHLSEAMAFDGNLERFSIQSILMNSRRLPVDKSGKWLPYPELAYHLDNKRFVAYLRKQIQACSIHHVDATITHGNPSQDGIGCLVDETGREFAFDFYVDCSGFQSLLMGKTLGSAYKSFGASLFTNRAITAQVPMEQNPRPYTIAKTMAGGWCWDIPQPESRHLGYVFCTDHLSDEAALEEMRAQFPDMGEPKFLNFGSGRRQDFVKGNLAVLGNAYGFVEPLESTSLHLLIKQIGLLLDALPDWRQQASYLNNRVNAQWDYLAWFLAIHYRFNEAKDTSFWRRCRHETDVRAYEELITCFQKHGPLSLDPEFKSQFPYPDPLWGPEGIDVILLGQGVQTSWEKNISKENWTRWLNSAQHLERRCLTQKQFMETDINAEHFASLFRQVGPAFE